MATTRATPASVVALRFDGAALWAIDQTELPGRARTELATRAEDVAEAIRRLAIRGAPLIGVAGAYGVVLELSRDPSAATRSIEPARSSADARPTAVNLAWPSTASHEAAARRARTGAPPRSAEARAIEAEEEAASDAIAAHGADLLAPHGGS